MQIFRMIGDRRIPFNLVLDSTMTVVEEGPDLELVQAQAMVERQSLIDEQQALMAKESNSAVYNYMQQARAAMQEPSGVTFMNQPTVVTESTQASTNESLTNHPLETKAVNDLIRQAAQNGHTVKTTDPKLIEKFPALVPITNDDPAPIMKGEFVDEQKPDGSIQRVYKPTPTDILVGTWVTELVTENPIPGTDELRAQYFKEVADLQARHEQNGTVCPSCEVGAVMRKWRAKLESLGFIQ
jgi:hypothetical protein